MNLINSILYIWACMFLLMHLFLQVYDKYIRTKALSIVYSCTSVLGAISGVYKVFS